MVIIIIKNIVAPEANKIERIINLRKKGKNIDEIRFELKTNESEVYKILKNNLENYKNYNIYLPANFIYDIITLRKKGKTQKEIAEQVRLSAPTIRNVLIANLEDYQKYNYPQKKNKTPKINLNTQERLNFFELLYDELILNLKLPNANQLKQQCFEVFYRIWSKVKKGSKLRDTFRLGPPVIYMFLKVRCFPLNTSDIIKNSHLNRVEFKKYLKLAVPYYPEYQKRNNAKLLVLKKINEIGTFFEFNSDFKEASEKIMGVFWPYIKNTIESVIVGVIVIRMSSAEYTIKNKVFKELHLDCFKGIKKSSELIKKIINIKLANFSFTEGSY
jgi:transcriptional regulator